MTETRGRTLPPPAKPKRRGHEPPVAEPTLVVDLRADAYPDASAAEPREPSGALVAEEPNRTPTEQPPQPTSIRVTVYSDASIDDFLAEVRVQAAIRRLDVTDSAVWRWAMTQLMERCTPNAVVAHFAAAAPKRSGGRPRR